MASEEKIALGRGVGYKNDHERDALAAAMAAFKKYKNKFIQVEKKAPSEIDPDEIKVLVVKGYSIENAIAEFTRAPVQEKRSPASTSVAEPLDPDAAVLRMHIQQLSEQVKTLRSYVDELRREMAGKDAALEKTNKVLDRLKDKTSKEIKRDHEIRIRDKEIGRLRSILRSERKYTKKLKRTVAAGKGGEDRRGEGPEAPEASGCLLQRSSDLGNRTPCIGREILCSWRIPLVGKEHC